MKQAFFCRLILICALVLNNHTLLSQTITTIAGGAIGPSSGDGGPATAAKIPGPACGSFDKNGNYYFGESATNPRIRMINQSGIITTVAGTGVSGFSGDGGPATLAKISYAYAVVDADGNIYISDRDNRRVRKVDAVTGVISTIAGNGGCCHMGDGGPATASSLLPSGLCVSALGEIYVNDSSTWVRKISPSGLITAVAGNGLEGFSGDGGPATAAQIFSSSGLCTDASGNLLLGCYGRIRRVDAVTGTITTIAGNGIITPFNGDGIPATAAQFNPLFIAVDNPGNIYIAAPGTGNERIRKIDVSGIIHTLAGNGISGFFGDGGPATAAQVYRPEGVAIDACNNLYVADKTNLRIRKITTVAPLPSLLIGIAVTPNDTVCAGTPVTFTTSTSGAGYTPGYKWYVNGTVVGTTSSSYTYTPADEDSVRCVLTSSCNGAIASSNSIHMVVKPVVTPGISLSGITSYAVGTSVTVTATVSGSGSYVIRWRNHGVIFATTSTPLVTYTKAEGIDTIAATVVSLEDCGDSTTSVNHFVFPPSLLAMQNISQAGCLNIYPNPVHNIVNVTGVTYKVRYKLVGIVGTVFREGELNRDNSTIGLDDTPVGVYMLAVNCADGSRSVLKIIKQ